MKRFKRPTRQFMYAFSVLIIMSSVIHGFIFYLIPKLYIHQKNQEVTSKMNELTMLLNQNDLMSMQQQAKQYAHMHNVNVSLNVDGQLYEYESFNTISVEIQLNTPKNITIISDEKLVDSESIVLRNATIQTDQNQPVNVQIASNLVLNEINQLTKSLLLYTVSFSLLIALILAFFYTKQVLKPLNKLLTTIKKMSHLEKDAYCRVNENDELNQVAVHVNELYLKLLNMIELLTNENAAISKQEQNHLLLMRAASHDLKTPLTSLRVLIENMSLNIGVYKNHDKYLSEALLIVDRLNSMIKEVLISQEQLDATYYANKQEISLNELIEDLVFDIELLKDEKKLTLNCRLDKTIISGNEQLLRKVISNLLLNAIQYTQTTGKIEVTLENNVLRIYNSCKPIEETKIKKLFEPFYRIQNDNNGSGMGLYIVKMLLDKENIQYSFKPVHNGMLFEVDFKR